MFTGQLAATTNDQQWDAAFELVDSFDNTPIDLTDCEISVQLYDDGVLYLSGSTSTGEVASPSPGVIDIVFTADRMRSIKSGVYTVSILGARDDVEKKIALATIVIVSGDGS